MGIKVLGTFPTHPPPHTNPIQLSFAATLNNVVPAHRRIFSSMSLPPDNGQALIQKISSGQNTIFASCDASLKNGHAMHAWIVSSGDVTDIMDPLLHVSDSGPVDGFTPFLSSARAVLTGITAATLFI